MTPSERDAHRAKVRLRVRFAVAVGAAALASLGWFLAGTEVAPRVGGPSSPPLELAWLVLWWPVGGWAFVLGFHGLGLTLEKSVDLEAAARDLAGVTGHLIGVMGMSLVAFWVLADHAYPGMLGLTPTLGVLGWFLTLGIAGGVRSALRLGLTAGGLGLAVSVGTVGAVLLGLWLLSSRIPGLVCAGLAPGLAIGLGSVAWIWKREHGRLSAA